MKRKTIKNTFSLEGIGLHTGTSTKMVCRSMLENHGIIFIKYTDGLGVEIKADVKNVISTTRSTTISVEGQEIKTIEHFLSAVYALGIDDLYIDIYGDEIPILDGSARYFVEALVKAEIIEKSEDKEYFIIDDLIEFKYPDTGTEFIALPSDNFEVSVLIDFKSEVVSKQFADLRNLDEFQDEFSTCRTFGFFSEIETLLDQGLVKGGNLENAIVIADRELTEKDIERFANKIDVKKINVKDNGILSAKPLKYHNEPARHKLLDFIGDISLIGAPMKGRFIVKRPGHRANVEFGKFLKLHMLKQKKLKGKPKFDLSAPALLDTMQIANMLPHRYPFLLVDKIIEMSENHIVGIKNLTYNEMLFQGHFPNNPIFPGVLQMEALAQTGGILALSLQEDKTDWDTYFLKMDQVKFKNMAVPGDTLIMKMELLQPIRRGIVQMRGTIYVGDKVISEGDLTAQIVKKINNA